MRPQTVMDAIFNHPRVYRIKISAVKLVAWPVSTLFIKNKIDPDAIVLKNIKPGESIYEIGCGDGNLYRLLSANGLAANFFGSDYNEHMVKFCAENYPEAQWEVHKEGPYIQSDQKFDWCVIRNVLHHIPSESDIVSTLREAARISSRVLLIEPMQSDNSLLAIIKKRYWAITDGGVNYFTLDQMHNLFMQFPSRIHEESCTEPLHQTYTCLYSLR